MCWFYKLKLRHKFVDATGIFLRFFFLQKIHNQKAMMRMFSEIFKLGNICQQLQLYLLVHKHSWYSTTTYWRKIISRTLFMILLLHKRSGGGILLKDINFLEIKRATLSHAYSATINKRNSSFKIFATSKIPSFCSRICLCCALFHIYDSFFYKDDITVKI